MVMNYFELFYILDKETQFIELVFSFLFWLYFFVWTGRHTCFFFVSVKQNVIIGSIIIYKLWRVIHKALLVRDINIFYTFKKQIKNIYMRQNQGNVTKKKERYKNKCYGIRALCRVFEIFKIFVLVAFSSRFS